MECLLNLFVLAEVSRMVDGPISLGPDCSEHLHHSYCREKLEGSNRNVEYTGSVLIHVSYIPTLETCESCLHTSAMAKDCRPISISLFLSEVLEMILTSESNFFITTCLHEVVGRYY